jgi:Rrf2 family protein
MFNKETEYALRSVVYIKGQNLKNRRPGVDEISKMIDAPRYFVAKILFRLVRTGFLGSVKGKGGGFYIEGSRSDITIIELVSHMEGSGVISGCIFGLSKCSDEAPCPLHEKYAPIRESVRNLLQTETISSLAEKYYESR